MLSKPFSKIIESLKTGELPKIKHSIDKFQNDPSYGLINEPEFDVFKDSIIFENGFESMIY
jgi:hypothetical protein